MSRNTKEKLKERVQSLNTLLERPTARWNDDASVSECNVGFLDLECQFSPTTYRLVEIISRAGAETDWSETMSAMEMRQFLDGMVKGIAIRNAQLGQVAAKNGLMRFGQPSDAPLYSDQLMADLHKLYNPA